MFRYRHFFIAGICTTLALLLALPLILYRMGLSDIDGWPSKPQQLASAEQQALVWQRAGGHGKPHVEPSNPYSYAVRMLLDSAAPQPGERLAWSFASMFLLKHRRHFQMGGWHLSGAALTIWITRNWTTEEILSAAGASGRFDKLGPRVPPP